MKEGIDCRSHPDFYVCHEEPVCDFRNKCMECEECPTYKVWYEVMRLLYKNNQEMFKWILAPKIPGEKE